MNADFTMRSRILIGYGDRQFHVFADEIITFLKACEKIDLPRIKDIVADLDDIKDIVIDSSIDDAAILKRHLQLLNHLAIMLQGAIFEQE